MLVLHSSLGSTDVVQDGTKPPSATSLANPMAVNRRLYLQVTSLCADSGPQCASDTLTAAGAQNLGVTKSYKELPSPWCTFCPDCNSRSEVWHTSVDCLPTAARPNMHLLKFPPPPPSSPFSFTDKWNQHGEGGKKDRGRRLSYGLLPALAYRNPAWNLFAFITIKCIRLHLLAGNCYIFTFLQW